MQVKLYEDIARFWLYRHHLRLSGEAVNGRYVMDPSPIPEIR